jgi:hypothetical protein
MTYCTTHGDKQVRLVTILGERTLVGPSANRSLLMEKLCQESEQAVSRPRLCFSFPPEIHRVFLNAVPTCSMTRFLADLG